MLVISLVKWLDGSSKPKQTNKQTKDFCAISRRLRPIQHPVPYSPLQWSETGMAQTRVASFDNALIVVRNSPSDTGLRAAGLGATLPPPGGFCGVTASWPASADMTTRDESQCPWKGTTHGEKMRRRRWQTNPVYLTKRVKLPRNWSKNSHVTWRENLNKNETSQFRSDTTEKRNEQKIQIMSKPEISQEILLEFSKRKVQDLVLSVRKIFLWIPC